MGDPRGPLARLLAAGLLIVGVAVGLIVYSEPVPGAGATPTQSAGGGGERDATPPPPTASLWVNAGSGATVYLDGAPIGEVPLWVDSVARGLRRVQIVDQEGFTVADTTLSVLPGRVTDFDLTAGAPPTTSLPEDFANADTAVPAPELATPVPRRPESPEPAPTDGTAPTAPALPPARRPAAQPAPAPATGELRITSSPAGAGVRLDGRRIGTTPLAVGGLRPGRYDVVVGRLGYETVSQPVEVRAGGVSETAVSLRATAEPPRSEPPRARPAPPPVPRGSRNATGAVEILVKPWGRIVIDGATHQRETDVIYQTVLSAGTHQVTVSHPQLGSATRSVFVPPDGQVRVEIDLAREGN